MTSEWQAIKPW